MSSAQVRLSNYLQYELYHSIGAYGIARERLADLEQRLREAHGPAVDEIRSESPVEQDELLRVTRISRVYNEQLARERHAARLSAGAGGEGALRHPLPGQLPLTLPERFRVDDTGRDVEAARRNPWSRPMAWAWVANFYDAAILAIDVKCRREAGARLIAAAPGTAVMAATFADNIACPRDRLVRRPTPDADTDTARTWRRARFVERRRRALKHLPGASTSKDVQTGDPSEFLPRIINDNLGSGFGSLPLFVVSALAEAHLSMHGVEAWKSMALGAHAKLVAPRVQSWLQPELDRCIALNTFVYCASRCAPWMFAEDDAERAFVFDDFARSWQHAVPTRCMWIAAQASLLALHRRAYSHALKGERTKAYNDYHKLQRQIRDTRRRVDSAPVHIAGAVEFLTGLDAQANQNIGELYRAEHAQQPALKHFQTALDRLEAVRRHGEMDKVLTNSRWHVELQISQGKASYEMGRHKDSLRWYLQGWRAFLQLLAAETSTEASCEAVDRAIAWLDAIKFEPELRKPEVQEHVGPVVAQLERITVNTRLGALAAEILLRLGHVLFVLNLGPDGRPPSGAAWAEKDDRAKLEEAREHVSGMLAFDCLRMAAACDRYSTLIGADLLKARYRFADWFNRADQDLPPAYKEVLNPPEMAAIADHWPRGGDDYERVARVAEYLMLLARMHPDAIGDRRATDPQVRDDTNIALDLLLNFFMHTDSINVRKAQVHRYLMKPPVDGRPPSQEGDPAIEFVCMRRYSSAFPLLPRPSAFRAHGGGYFVRLHASGGEPPFGIVVDPGFDFVENLYRAGFSLGDIGMIFVTHDHVDHLSSLESLLSLLHYRSDLLQDQAKGEPADHEGSAAGATPARKAPPLVYGNASIVDRYASVDGLKPESYFKDLETLSASDPRRARAELPHHLADFEILAMSSEDVDGHGHLDLSRNPSYGICIRHTRLPLSLAITSDTPAPPPDPESRRHATWRTAWRAALEADVLVAHLSTVPLTELRQMARLDARRAMPRSDDAEQLAAEVAASIERADDALALLATMRSEEIERRIVEVEKECARKGEPVADDPEHADLMVERGRVERVLTCVEELRAAFERLLRAATLLREQLPPNTAQKDLLRKWTRKTANAAEAIELSGAKLRALLDRGKDHPDRDGVEHRPVLRDQLAQLELDARMLAVKAQISSREAEQLEQIRAQLQAGSELRGQIEFALWLRSHTPGPTADLVGLVPSDPSDLTRDWKPPRDHPYLRGMLTWARAYREEREQVLGATDAKAPARGLFVLGELSEELGTVRGKIAGRINQTIFAGSAPDPADNDRDRFWALTSDVGLQVFVVPRLPEPDGSRERTDAPVGLTVGCAKVLCTTCNLDEDRVAQEIHHPAHRISEVCVKGENEGIFYNCDEHDPGNQLEPLFLEQLERFDVFGR